MYAAMGDGEHALEKLNELPRFLTSTTMYAEAGPCIETPLSAAQSIRDMLLQSWGDTIRVFPALPRAWKNAVFMDLRTQGAFSVSASARDGKTEWVSVKSLAGEPFHIRSNISGEVLITGDGAKQVKKLSEDLYELNLAKGDEVTFSDAASSNESFVVEPVANPVPYCFGLPLK